MLLDDLYKIVSESIHDEGAEYSISIDPSHAIYSGHFPGFPVTPGVVELEIVKELTERLLDRKLTYTKILNCKFTHILNPTDIGNLSVDVSFVKVESTFKVAAKIHDSSYTYLIVKASYCLA